MTTKADILTVLYDLAAIYRKTKVFNTGNQNQTSFLMREAL